MNDDELVDRLRDDYARLPTSGEPVDAGAVAHRARRSRRRRRTGVAAAVLGAAAATVAAGLGLPALVEDGDDAGRDRGPASGGLPTAMTPYDGPLDAPGRFGAAGRAIDCAYPPTGGDNAPGDGVYAEGATSDTPAAAVETAYSEGLFLSLAPDLDLAVAADDGARQLLTYEVDGRILAAIVVRDGPGAEGTGGDGWYVESWARCDFAELPEETARDGFTTYGAWTDSDGVPVPVAEVYSGPGPDHCGWETMEFLVVDGDGARARVYVEEPARELRRSVAGPYRIDVRLPGDARATGWEREGRRLWLSADGRYAYVGSAASVAAWPRLETGCV